MKNNAVRDNKLNEFPRVVLLITVDVTDSLVAFGMCDFVLGFGS